jgi:hypothetical protein
MPKRGVFDFDSLTPNLKRLLPVVDAAVDLAFDTYEPIAETWMRDNAKWTDRTTNARNGLFAKHISDPMVEHQLVLYHTMPYGLWLEVRWSGKYAIIGPGMFHIAPLLTERCVTTIDYAISRLPK